MKNKKVLNMYGATFSKWKQIRKATLVKKWGDCAMDKVTFKDGVHEGEEEINNGECAEHVQPGDFVWLLDDDENHPSFNKWTHQCLYEVLEDL